MNTPPRVLNTICSALAVFSLISPIEAQWIGTSPNLDYNDTANWAGGIVTDTFQGPYGWASAPAMGSTGQFSFTSGVTTISTGTVNAYGLAVGQSITGAGIPAGATITAINSANSITISAPTTSASSDNYTAAALNNPWNINLGATHTVTGNFTYRNTDPANVIFTPLQFGGSIWNFAAAKPVITVEMGMPNIGRMLQMGAGSRGLTWNFQNADPVFAINPGLASIGQGASADTLALYATIDGANSLTKTGGGRLELYRTATINGPVNVQEGVLRLRAASTTVFGKIEGASAYNVSGIGTALDLLAGDAGVSMLGTTTPVNLQSGALTLGSSFSQAVGEVNLMGGRNAIANYSASDKSLILSGLNRQNFGTVNFVGNNQGSRDVGVGTLITINGDDSNILADLVGGGGTAGSTTISILPWATASRANANEFAPADNSAWAGSDLVTYTQAGGFRALNATEYYAANGTTLLNGAGAQDNVKLSYAATLSDDLTVNAISMGANNLVQTIAAGKVLTITSGALTTGGNTVTFSGGTINTGANALIVTGRSSVYMSSSITNSITDPKTAGVIFANMGNGVFLNGVNTYGGFTLVQGYVTVNNSSALPSATELRIDFSGRTTIGNSVSAKVQTLSGSGTLDFLIGGNANKLNVGTVAVGANNTLTVGDGGTISPGDLSGNNTAGTLLLGNNVNTVAFQEGSTFAVDLGSDTSFDMLQNLNANGTNTLSINGGTLLLNYLNDYNPLEGTSWLLTSGFNATAGSAELMSVVDTRGYDYTLSFQGNNLLLTLNAVPEPSTYALLGLSGLALILAARKRRRACI